MEPDNVGMSQLLSDLGLLVYQLELSGRHSGGGDDLGGKLLPRDLAHAPLDRAEGALPELFLELVVVAEVVIDTALVDIYRDDDSFPRHRERGVRSLLPN